MNRAYFNHWDKSARPGRQQNLFVGVSRHLFCLKDGTLRYQKRPIEPRLSERALLMRFVLLDADSGLIYGEYHPQEDADLRGFLARAWSDKQQHLMRGVPETLRVPHGPAIDPFSNDVEWVSARTGVRLASLPSGFGAGGHAVRLLEKTLVDWMWRYDFPLPLAGVAAGSALLSMEASGPWAGTWKDGWSMVPPLTQEALDAFDAAYRIPGGWRKGLFENVLRGVPGQHV
jgi:hypothetical protein